MLSYDNVLKAIKWVGLPQAFFRIVLKAIIVSLTCNVILLSPPNLQTIILTQQQRN